METFNKHKQNIIAMAGIAVFWLGISLITGTACWFQSVVGLPCPGCGLTRSFMALASGAWREAFFWHPLLPIAIALLPFALPLFIILRRHKQKKALEGMLWAMVFAILAVYAMRMLLYFPHTEPLTVHQNTLWRLALHNISGQSL
jgi:hypothetical protein